MPITTQKMARVNATFRGSGPFPIDMLRYDRCWPLSQEDIAKIAESLSGDIGSADAREIRVGTHATLAASKDETAFTNDRWKSFGWLPVAYEVLP